MLSEKTILQEELKKRIDNFIYSSKKNLTLPDVSKIPNRLFSKTFTVYSKRTEKIGNGFIDFINKDHESNFFVWRTTPDNIKHAIRSGILNYESLTAKLISALGQYNHSVHNRAYLHGIVSDKHQLKTSLLEISQSNIEALQIIEKLINQYDHSQSSKHNLNRVLDALEQYKTNIKQNYTKLLKQSEKFKNYDPEILNKWQIQYELLTQQTKQYENNIHNEKISNIYKSYISNSLLDFIKQQSQLHIRNVQEINQNLIYSRFSNSFFRGDFHNICLDALKEINDFEFDYYNPVLAEHQGEFNDKEKLIAVNFHHLKKNQDKINETFMAICQIEGVDQISKDQCSNYYMKKDNGYNYQLQQTIYTKWFQQSSKSLITSRALAWFWNITAGIIFGLTFDLVAGLISGLAGYKFESIADKFKFNIKNPATLNTTFDKLNSFFKFKKYSLGTLIGFKLITFVKNIYIDLKSGAVTTAKQYRIELWDNLSADFTEGHKTQNKDNNYLKKLTLKITELEDEYIEIINNIKKTAPKFYNNYQAKPLNTIPAVQPYNFSDGEWLDLGNSLISGLKVIGDNFTHSINSKNPFLGLMFCSAYSIAALAILKPAVVNFLPRSYVYFCNTLAKALSKGKSTGAIAGASMQAQWLTTALEASINGNTSWLATSSKIFENDSSNILIYTTLAVSLGALIAYKLNIPFISQAIRDDLGNMPLPSLGMAGGKLGFLLVHLLEEREHKISPKELEQQSEQIKLSKSLVDKINFHKFSLLSFLENKKYFLPDLDQTDKREILNHIDKFFPNKPEIYRSIDKMLNPIKHQSIFLITLQIPLNYIPLLLRCFLTPITQSITPFKALYKKNHHDLTRLFNILGNAVHGIASIIKVIITSLFEVIVNETLARGEASINNSHNISNSSYKILKAFDKKFEISKTYTGQTLNQHKSQFNQPSPFHVFTNKTSLSSQSYQENTNASYICESNSFD